VAAFFTSVETRTLAAAVDRLIPPDDSFPGAAGAGAVEYVEGLLTAFEHDPPRIWATATDAGTTGWLQLGPAEAWAWRTRVEGWQQAYRAGLTSLGHDFAEVDGDEQDRRLAADEDLRWLLYIHACEAVYGDPAYGGNREAVGWISIAFPGDPFPAGYPPEEVTDRG